MNDFEIQATEKDGISILYVEGFLDAHTVSGFESTIQRLVKDKNYKIVVNMQKLEYISSAGLGVFMGFIEEIREQGGDIKLSNLSDKVFRVFDLIGFPALFDILPTEEEAIKKFNAS